jgi:anion-transporting  ArsA/GET3 family ATPase
LDILNRRLIFTMGKGGVGKSLVSAVLTRLGKQSGIHTPINHSLTQLVLARQNLGPIPT